MAVTTPAGTTAGTTSVDPLDTFLTTTIPETEHDSAFWASTPFLSQLHDAAVDHMRNPWGVLMSLMARATLAIPVDVYINTDTGGVSPLNLFVAAVGRSGSGKTQAMNAAEEIMPDVPVHTTVIPSITSGEGLLARFASAEYDTDPDTGKPDRKGGTHMALRNLGVLAEVDEVTRFSAQAGRDCSTTIGTMLSGWAGQSLGDTNKSEDKQTAIPARVYRLSAVIGVQPAAARILVEGDGAGFTQRFLWCTMGLTERPIHPRGHRVPWPECSITIGDRAWSAWQDVYRSGVTKGLRPRILTFPDWVEDAAEDAKWLLQEDGSSVDALDSHVIQLTERVAAILSIIEAGGIPVGSMVSADTWNRATYIIRYSRRARTRCFADYAASCSEAEARRLAIRGMATEAAEARVEDAGITRCKRAIVRTLYARLIAAGADLQPDAMERAGMLGGQIRHGLASRMRGRWLPAMTDLLDDGVVEVVGDHHPGEPLERLEFTITSPQAIPPELRPEGMQLSA